MIRSTTRSRPSGARALEGLRYGQVVVIVQDGVVIQVDRTERRRLRPTAAQS